jgi:UDPglucose 6-dehydrogenase
MSRTIVRLVVAAAWLAFGSVGAAFAQADDLPAGAVALTAPELLALYGGKTWKWGEGGAFFEKELRSFKARTVNDTGGSTALGRWRITDAGELCIIADWMTATSTSPAVTCWNHAQVRGDIYQRKLPDGSWYVFKHAVTEPGDQFNKLVAEDLVGVVDRIGN